MHKEAQISYNSATNNILDPLITFWDVMEPDTKQSHASVPLRCFFILQDL